MREPKKIPEHLREDVARCAHTIWCHHMIEQGWTPGDRYDASAKVHDALRRFDVLSPLVRELIADWIDSDEVAGDLCNAVEFAMQDDEQSAAMVEVGSSVRMSRPDPSQPIDSEDDYIGRVVECVERRPKCDRLESIKVLWPDGEIVEYPPIELEVVRGDA